MEAKYFFTTEADEEIRYVYRERGTGRGEVAKLAQRLGMPRWRVSRRAREIGAYLPRIKEPPWSERELAILERNAHKHPETIARILKRNGFVRSATAVLLKRKRQRLLQNLGGWPACEVAQCFGVDTKVITSWITRGYLKATRRGTQRTAAQGGG